MSPRRGQLAVGAVPGLQGKGVFTAPLRRARGTVGRSRLGSHARSRVKLGSVAADFRGAITAGASGGDGGAPVADAATIVVFAKVSGCQNWKSCLRSGP